MPASGLTQQRLRGARRQPGLRVFPGVQVEELASEAAWQRLSASSSRGAEAGLIVELRKGGAKLIVERWVA